MSSEESAFVPVRELPADHRSREIQEQFIDVYNKKPNFYIRVPGRVNLIGEHVDYCGYSVCPMALAQDIMLAVCVEEDTKLILQNLDPKFQDFQCDLINFEIKLGEGAPQWYQYFLCGVKGVLDILPEDAIVKGMKVLVSGNIPPSAGLSSSSALVSSAALATSHTNKFPLTKEKIANLCAECERYIGTQGGGMDQAIAFLGTKGCAKHIQFNPLRAADVALPEGATFVIAHSLTQLNKAATADYNCRVVECRLAAQIIAKKQGVQWTTVRKLADIQQALKLDLEEMITLTRKILHEQPYTKEEVIQELETSGDVLDETSLTPNTSHIQSFKLQQRALHVFQEALRVQKFHETCAQDLDSKESLSTLGRLMSESHDSLRDLYECSHPQLDKLVELSRRCTLGSRLTGAGWGGCAVSLMTPSHLEEYLRVLKEEFYEELGTIEEIDIYRFVSAPEPGACIYVEN